MKKLKLIGLIMCGYLSFGCGSSEPRELTSKVQFATIEKAKELLTTEDLFTDSWSQFDIDARLQKNKSSKTELLKYISSQALEWTIAEKNKITEILQDIDNEILKNGFKINFPDQIFFIKTTMKEEGGANGYTRANHVVLKEDIISMSNGDLKQLIIHELFHVLSRNDSGFRKEMYGIIGFKIMNAVSYPDSIKDFRITNPDAPQTDSYITLEKDNQAMDCMMILYSTENYNGGGFFKYLNVGFLKLKGSNAKEVAYEDGKPLIYTFKEVSNFFEQVGENTKYIIHPEEILADNFAYTITNKTGLSSQWIVEKIQDVLREEKK